MCIYLIIICFVKQGPQGELGERGAPGDKGNKVRYH